MSIENPYLLDLLKNIRESYKDNEKVPMSEWVCRNTKIRGFPFSFNNGYGFQKQIADDLSQRMVVKKLSQVGLTELQMRKAVAFVVQNKGTNLIYALPDLDMMERNSTTRMKPILDGLDENKFTRGISNKSVYQINDSFIYMMGNSEGDATSTPADYLMVDEEDLSDPEILALFNSRIQNSDFKIRQDFSTPTYAGTGISAEFDISDQHEYMKKCEHCGHQQIPDYDARFLKIPGLPDSIGNLVEDLDTSMLESLDMENVRVVCERCRRPIDLNIGREWVPRFPNRTTVRGYWVKCFSTTRLSPKYLIETMVEYKRKGYLRRGVNTTLGREYEDKESRLSVAAMREVMKGSNIIDVPKDTPIYIGMDMGIRCHITLGYKREDGAIVVFRFLTCLAADVDGVISDIFKQYHIVRGLVDRHPLITDATRISRASNLVLLPAEYRGSKEFGFTKDRFGVVDHVQIDRTMAIDKVADSIKRQSVEMYGYEDQGDILIEHMQGMTREVDPDTKAPRWVKLNTNDHFFHALAFLFSAMDLLDLRAKDKEGYIPQFICSAVGQYQVDNRELIGYNAKSEIKSGKKAWELKI